MPGDLRSHERIKYSRITPYIYVGTNLCCRDHSLFLQKLGVSVDIDLGYEHGERVITKPMEITLYLPTRDHHAPSLEKLIVGASLLDIAVRAKKRVYVHCKNGHGRAPALVAAYLMTRGMSLQEALAFLKERRPVAHLNREQRAALHRFRRWFVARGTPR